ncbi:MAG: sigma-70 family RNA polymerase sigma factor [Planctomycetota bacterium]
MSCLTSDPTVRASHFSEIGVVAEQAIYREYQSGATIKVLARRFRQAQANIARLVGRMRTQQILEMPLRYVPLEDFSRILADPALEKSVLGPMSTDTNNLWRPVRAPCGVVAYLASLYEIPILTRLQEGHLFRKMNYLKYKAMTLREKLNLLRPSSARMDEIEECRKEALVVRNQLIRVNLRLVVSVAKRHVGPMNSLFELISDGNLTLMQAVENFDFSRGNRFSSYVMEALKKTFVYRLPAEHRRQGRLRTTCDKALLFVADESLDPSVQETVYVQKQDTVARILNRLDARDRQILIWRFGLRLGSEPLKLHEIGTKIGVSRERVRQIASRAIKRLRVLIEGGEVSEPC